MKDFNLKRISKHIWPTVRKYPLSTLGMLLTYGFGVFISDVTIPVLYKRLINALGELSPSVESFATLQEIFVTLVVAFLVFNIAYRIGDYSLTYSQSNMLKDLSDHTFRRLTKHSHRFFADNFAGALVAKMKRFVSGFETIYDNIVFHFWFLIIPLIGMLVVVFNESALLGILFSAWIVVYLVITLVFVRYKLRFDLVEANEDSNVTARFSDVITNVITMKIFSSRVSEIKKFSKITEAQKIARSKSWNFQNFQFAVQAFMMAVLELGGMYTVLLLWSRGDVGIGTVVLLQIFIGSVFMKTWSLGRSIGRIIKSAASMQEMVDILDQPLDVTDPVNPEELRMKDGAVSFQDITFIYDDGEGQEVFEDFNLEIPAGQKVGLVGYSGSGKTTLTKLLLRFSNVQSGQITVDGQNICNVTQDDLRRVLSYVPQEPLLFHRSLRENIAYPRPEASMDEVIEAARQARAHEFIDELTDKYETFVGERGIKLSGGQRQRVAIARVLLERAPILVLDEATSSLDSVSEKLIQEALEVAMKGRTSIVIAHRLSTIMAMDRIIVLDKGKIAEDGTHSELIARGGKYAELWEHQHGGLLGADADDQSLLTH